MIDASVTHGKNRIDPSCNLTWGKMTYEHEYTQRGLSQFRRRGDAKSGALPRSEQMQTLAESLRNRSFKFSTLRVVSGGRKPKYAASTYDDVVVLRAMTRSLRRAFGQRQEHRDAIVHSVKSLIADTAEAYVLRVDLSGFFESVDRARLLDSIRNNRLVPPTTLWLLEQLFSAPALQDCLGLPRGLAVSSALADVYMRSFDTWLARKRSVFFSVRYVDDIIAFSSEPTTGLEGEMSRELSLLGLRLNSNKTARMVRGPRPSASLEPNAASQSEIEFLGYAIRVSDLSTSAVQMHLSAKRVRRLHHRLVKAFRLFAADKDFGLLKLRIQLLTGNYALRGWNRRGELKTGVYFGNRLLTEEGKRDLREADKWLRALVFLKRGRIGRALNAQLTASQRREIVRMSFLFGFENKVYRSVSTEQLKRARTGWIRG